MPQPLAQRAALTAALDAVGDRWTLLVIASLLDGARRFGELQEDVGAIAPNVLADRLRKLERQGLVLARPYSERPPRYVYEVSASGAELADTLALLAGWAARNSPAENRPTHALCGTPLQLRWWCPTCGEPAEEDDSESHLL